MADKIDEEFERWLKGDEFSVYMRAIFRAGFERAVELAATALRDAWDKRSRVDIEGYPQALDEAMTKIRALGASKEKHV